MVSVASGGRAERIASRILFKAPRAGSGIPARYSSMSFGAALRFAAERRSTDLVFFTRTMLAFGCFLDRLLHSLLDDVLHGVSSTSVFEHVVARFGYCFLDGLPDGRCDGMQFLY